MSPDPTHVAPIDAGDPVAPRIFEPDYYERMRRLESESWWNAGMRLVAARLLNPTQLPAQGTLLDVGCGSGQTMGWALDLLGAGWHAVGLDVAMDGVAAARAAGFNVLHASALDIPLPNESVDVVITLDVLQHLPLGGGDVAALREMRRVLKPGGTLFIRTNAQSFPRTRDDAAFNFRKYEPGHLRLALVAAGFRVRRLSRINALLGLAEIPRELRANREQRDDGYHGLLATPSTGSPWGRALKRWWLSLEGRIIALGIPLPIGRTIVAVCVRPTTPA
ncbi:MAG: methyltransferase domain-containing protein [Gemmatimonadota bacterium]|nr:methyltransferase domain-containing protein [Gemmatimonadota bacterium]